MLTPMRGTKTRAQFNAARAREHFRQARENAEDRNAFEIPLRWWVVAGVGVIVAVSALFGGWAPAERSMATVAASSPLVNDILTAQVHEVYTDSSWGERVEADDGEVVLVAQLTLENTWTEPVAMQGTADRVEAEPLGNGDDAIIRIAGIPDGVYPDFHRTAGSSGNVVLQPGVPVDVTATWIVPKDAAPTSITLTMYGVVLERGNVLISYHKRFWTPTNPLQTMTVDVASGARS